MKFFLNYWRPILYSAFGLSICWIIFTTYQTNTHASVNYFVPQIGFQAPDFKLNDLNGNSYQLSEFKGKAVLLNVWASWCKPCQAEMPALQNIYEQYKDKNIVFLAVNSTRQDSLSDVTNFVNNYNLTFPVLLDYDGSVSNTFHIQALPTTFFINPNGIIQEIIIGGPMSEALLEIRIKEIIGNE
jgi:peroxiredoxin